MRELEKRGSGEGRRQRERERERERGEYMAIDDGFVYEFAVEADYFRLQGRDQLRQSRCTILADVRRT
jgi:hypothetical protein